jgi:hypothetical protein
MKNTELKTNLLISLVPIVLLGIFYSSLVEMPIVRFPSGTRTKEEFALMIGLCSPLFFAVSYLFSERIKKYFHLSKTWTYLNTLLTGLLVVMIFINM